MATEPASEPLDLASYLARIEFGGQPRTDFATLAAIHRAHATHIPFENLDVLSGLPIRLDVASLQAKLVAARRGGYCFEQNSLLAGALEAIGFRVKRLLVRVRFQAQHVLPLTHMALEVEADGRAWLADVGFGGHGLLDPIELCETEVQQGAWRYRLAREDDRWWVLQAPHEGGWSDMYVFTRDGYLPVDYEPPNFYVSHNPQSPFVRFLIAQRPLPEVRYLLRGQQFIVERPDETTSRTLSTSDEIRSVLAEHFALVAPDGPWLEKLNAPPTW